MHKAVKFIIIQTGEPVEFAKPFGRFADYFVKSMSLTAAQVVITDVHRGESLPTKFTDLCGVVITGSAAMVTEQSEWMINTQRWLEIVIGLKIPVLGVCFGHQLLADLLGGQVAYNPKGRNMGYSVCHLTQAGTKDLLLGSISTESHFNTLVSHQQSVIQLPQSVERLAYCDRDENHAFRYQNHVWGMQFHPEWTVAIMQAYIKQRQADLQAEGFDPQSMLKQLQPCNKARQVLLNFKNLNSTA